MGFRGRGFKSRRADWLKDKKPQALHRIRCEACSFSPGNPLYVHQVVESALPESTIADWIKEW
jgi:hypothetical protein